MKDLSSVETLTVPEGVEIKIKSRVVSVTGPRGTLTKAVKHIQMDMQIVSVDLGVSDSIFHRQIVKRPSANAWSNNIQDSEEMIVSRGIRIYVEGKATSVEDDSPSITAHLVIVTLMKRPRRQRYGFDRLRLSSDMLCGEIQRSTTQDSLCPEMHHSSLAA